MKIEFLNFYFFSVFILDVFQRNGDIWFRVSDLIEGFIYYAHSRDLGGNQDVFSFQVVDGHSTTATYTLNILIEVNIV